MTEKTNSLWQWFADNEQKIKDAINDGTAFEREYIVESLNDLILDLGMFSWEIGPGQESEWSLTISPNGDRKRMLQSKKIIETAPSLGAWEFHYCKPARAWDRTFQLYDDFMIQHVVDASGWHFVSLPQPDGLIHITLEAPNIGRLDSYTAQTAAEIVVTNEIGEESKILHVGTIEIVREMVKDMADAKASLSYLRRWVEELIRLQ